jgi:hypothetical protein
VNKAAFLVVLSLVTFSAAADELPLLGDPAELVDNAGWLAAQNKFHESGSETRAFSDLVTILYDWDNGRPWGKEYVPEVNARLGHFRELVCVDAPALAICKTPGIIGSGKDVVLAEESLLNSATIASLSQRWNVKITPWLLPGRDPLFSVIAATSASQENVLAKYWDLSAQRVQISTYFNAIIPDATNYRAGFDSKDVPAMFAVNPSGLAIDDRQLRQRASDFAAAWKHALASNRATPPAHALADANEIQLQKIFDSEQPDFVHAYKDLLAKVADSPDLRIRFERERRDGDYPQEVYQQVAYASLLEMARVQGLYLTLAQSQRLDLSPRQRALESLLTLQRYSSCPQIFALEVTTLLDPFASHGYVLDENTDAALASTFVLENLKALLGMGVYDGQGTFPAMGKGLLNPVLFDDPDIAKTLNGRKFASLKVAEQIEILQKYLQPDFGKIRAMAVVRMGTLFLQSATTEELHQLAETIHRQHANPVEMSRLTPAQSK